VIGIDGTNGVPRWGSVVNGIWRLRRRQRVIVDLGGAYFQALFVGALILLHGILPGLVPGAVIPRAVVIVDLVILFSLAPRWRADGFWLAADLAGTRYPRVDEPVAADRGPEQSRSVPGIYAAWYGLLASTGFAGLWIWLAGHPAFDTRIAGAGLAEWPAIITPLLALGLKALVLAGLALSLWTGLTGLAAGASGGRSRTRPGVGA
jgi:hypothetical protein